MDDQTVLDRIQRLVDEEHQLDQHHERTPEDHQRYRALQVELDQCWDLLRQRRARREFHQDPDEAKVRDADTVEHYKQ
jgi:hypothetical protein